MDRKQTVNILCTEQLPSKTEIKTEPMEIRVNDIIGQLDNQRCNSENNSILLRTSKIKIEYDFNTNESVIPDGISSNNKEKQKAASREKALNKNEHAESEKKKDFERDKKKEKHKSTIHQERPKLNIQTTVKDLQHAQTENTKLANSKKVSTLREGVGKSQSKVPIPEEIPSSQVDIPLEGDVSQDFPTLNNLDTHETLVLNFANTLDGIKIVTKPKEVVLGYKTNEVTNIQDDLKKCLVISASKESKQIYNYEYTMLAHDKYICNHCQKLKTSYRRLSEHIKLAHRENCRMVQCPYCPYKNKFDIRTHILYNHKSESEIQWFKCNECEYKFKTKFALKRHVRSHATNEQIADFLKHCKLCDKGFRSGNSLKDHIKHVHNKMKKKRLKCDKCDYHTTTHACLKHHIEVNHINEQDLPLLQCKHCSFTTRYSQCLKKHDEKHKTEFCCDQCGYKTGLATSFRLHQISHKKDNDESKSTLQCDQCDYKTYRHYSLRVHKLNHLRPDEVRYFYCYHCDFKAKRKDNLKTHILRHFKKDEVSFRCYLCEFETKARSSLSKHLEKHSKHSSSGVTKQSRKKQGNST